MSRWRRRLAILAVLFVFLLLSSLVGVPLYLRSDSAKRLVARDLGELLETTATIGSLRAGLIGSSVIEELRFYDHDSTRPYLEVERVRVDVSLASAIAGKRLPDRLELQGVHLHLRFDHTGKLLTALPVLPRSGRLPHLRLQGLTLTLDQEGRPPLILEQGDVTLSPDRPENLLGELNDPRLGKFALTGRFGQGKLHLNIQHAGLALTPEQFRQLPFLPKNLTRRLDAAGTIPLDLSLWFGPEPPRARYRVGFRQATVRIAQDDRPPLVVTGASGLVEGDDQQFRFKGEITDPRWGQWSLAATQADDRLELQLHTAEMRITPDRLVDLPFVPPTVWDHLDANGSSSVALHLRYFLDQQDYDYRVQAEPKLQRLRLKQFGLEANQVSGRLLVENHRITLQQMTAETAEGMLTLAGELDFRAEPAQLSFDLAVANVRLSRLPASWNIPPEVEGQLTGQGKVSLSLEESGLEPRLTGSAKLEQLRIADFALNESVQIRLRDDGSASHLEAELALNNVDLSPLARRFDLRLSGLASLMARVQVPLQRIQQIHAWRGVARLTSEAVEIGGVAVQDLSANLLLTQGHLYMAHARADAAGGVVNASLDYDLDRQRAQGTLHARGLDFGPWQRLEHVAARIQLDRQQLELSDLSVLAYGGRLTGWLRVPWDELSIQAELFLAGLDIGRLSRMFSRSSFEVKGQVSGQASVFYRHDDGMKLQLDLESAQLALLGVPVRNLRGRLDWLHNQGVYKLSGDTLAGKVVVEGRYPPNAIGQGGQLKLEQLRLSELWNSLRLEAPWSELDGILSLKLPFRHEPNERYPTALGSLEVRQLSWRDREWMEQFSIDVEVADEGITLRDGSGLIGGGKVRLSGEWGFLDPARRWIHLGIRGVQPEQLLAPYTDMKDLFQGGIDASLRLDFGSEWRGAGAFSLSRGKMYGVEVSDWRLPVEFTFAPSTRHGELSIRESTAQLGNGRAQLRATLRYAGYLHLEGELQVFDAGLRSLASLIGEAASIIRGRMTGRIDFSSTDLRSLNDLSANVQAKFNDTQAFQLPILRALVPHLVPGRGSLDFQAGEVRGRLSGGVFRISEMTLDSSFLLLFIQGTVTLQGRLDLDVMAQTSSIGLDPVMLRSLLRRLPAVGPIPVGVLVRVTEALSDRVMHLRVGGTLRSPRVWVEPIRLLSDQAARFFLNKAMNALRP